MQSRDFDVNACARSRVTLRLIGSWLFVDFRRDPRGYQTPFQWLGFRKRIERGHGDRLHGVNLRPLRMNATWK